MTDLSRRHFHTFTKEDAGKASCLLVCGKTGWVLPRPRVDYQHLLLCPRNGFPLAALYQQNRIQFEKRITPQSQETTGATGKNDALLEGNITIQRKVPALCGRGRKLFSCGDMFPHASAQRGSGTSSPSWLQIPTLSRWSLAMVSHWPQRTVKLQNQQPTFRAPRPARTLCFFTCPNPAPTEQICPLPLPRLMPAILGHPNKDSSTWPEIGIWRRIRRAFEGNTCESTGFFPVNILGRDFWPCFCYRPQQGLLRLLNPLFSSKVLVPSHRGGFLRASERVEIRGE